MSLFAILAEGGQTWMHRIRMVRQVLKTASLLSLFFCTILFAFEVKKVPIFAYKAILYHIKAYVYHTVNLKTTPVDVHTWEKISRERRNNSEVPTKVVLGKTSPLVNAVIRSFSKGLINSLKYYVFFFGGTLLFFVVRGRHKKEHISGRKMVSPRNLAFKMRLKGQASKISIGGLPLLKGTETQHILITGGTGSGKTNCIHHILSQIRKEKKKILVVDTSGIFVEKYFDPKSDILLNPFDEKSADWHPWCECRTPADFDEIAECFIPKSLNENENYWRIAAQSLLSSILSVTKTRSKISELKEWILYRPIADLADFVVGTKAAAHIDLRSEKTAASIRSVASSFLGCLETLRDTNNPFSISDWLKKENASCLFLLTKPSHRTSLGPLLSCWISLAIRSLLQLPPDLDRRLWFILDELPTLNKIKDLESFLAEGRKYGGCGLLALQSPSQLNSIYGHDVTKTIIGNCATKVVFSEQDPTIADLISKSFGEREVLEYSESISYGANTVRDGVNLSESKKRQPLVFSSEIQALKKNQAFVKMPGNLPVSKIKLPIFRVT